jgi:hypothetical protein
MALQITAIAKQWLSSNNVDTPTDTNATLGQQQRKDSLCAVRADMSQAGQVSEESAPCVESGLITSTVALRAIGGDKKGS